MNTQNIHNTQNIQQIHNGQFAGKEYNGIENITKALYQQEQDKKQVEGLITELRKITQNNKKLVMKYQYNIYEGNRYFDYEYMMPIIYQENGNQQRLVADLPIEGYHVYRQ
ncbi:MAG: hypothetical protein ABIC91_05730 [Nanoarchaeota archaeon]|nr:hypothetical protein [Nanoarchaeota archaeon]MBU1030801.1 hypothetical protein [Nanoarchaeota archaeon]MBU1849545.1 hypothetical protein [Nanoarchaeota archaeon]